MIFGRNYYFKWMSLPLLTWFVLGSMNIRTNGKVVILKIFYYWVHQEKVFCASVKVEAAFSIFFFIYIYIYIYLSVIVS